MILVNENNTKRIKLITYMSDHRPNYDNIYV